MIYLLDTSALSDWINENPKIRSRIVSLPSNDRIVICAITRGEVLFGVIQLPDGKRKVKLTKNADLAFNTFPGEPIPITAGDHYAKLKLDQRKKGLVLDENDLWLAATTLALEATLVSRDSDFERIEGFPVEDWSR